MGDGQSVGVGASPIHARPVRSIFSNALNFCRSAIAALVRSPCRYCPFRLPGGPPLPLAPPVAPISTAPAECPSDCPHTRFPTREGPPAWTGGNGPARSSGVRPLGLGRLRSRQRDWDKPRGSGRFKLDHPRCRFQPQHEDFRQHGTASLVRPFDVGDALPVQNRMLRPTVWPRTCKHFIITVSSGFVGMLGGGRITDRCAMPGARTWPDVYPAGEIRA
jgi:hypothetical protein